MNKNRADMRERQFYYVYKASDQSHVICRKSHFEKRIFDGFSSRPHNYYDAKNNDVKRVKIFRKNGGISIHYFYKQ